MGRGGLVGAGVRIKVGMGVEEGKGRVLSYGWTLGRDCGIFTWQRRAGRGYRAQGLFLLFCGGICAGRQHYFVGLFSTALHVVGRASFSSRSFIHTI